MRDYSLKKQKTLVYVASLLIACLFLHIVVYNHQHPKFLGEGVQATLHGEDKKIFHAILAPSDFILGKVLENFFQKILVLGSITAVLDFLNFFILKLFNPLLLMLKRGVLQPKICL